MASSAPESSTYNNRTVGEGQLAQTGLLVHVPDMHRVCIKLM